MGISDTQNISESISKLDNTCELIQKKENEDAAKKETVSKNIKGETAVWSGENEYTLTGYEVQRNSSTICDDNINNNKKANEEAPENVVIEVNDIDKKGIVVVKIEGNSDNIHEYENTSKKEVKHNDMEGNIGDIKKKENLENKYEEFTNTDFKSDNNTRKKEDLKKDKKKKKKKKKK